jgi:hypothetical protein
MLLTRSDSFWCRLTDTLTWVSFSSYRKVSCRSFLPIPFFFLSCSYIWLLVISPLTSLLRHTLSAYSNALLASLNFKLLLWDTKARAHAENGIFGEKRQIGIFDPLPIKVQISTESITDVSPTLKDPYIDVSLSTLVDRIETHPNDDMLHSHLRPYMAYSARFAFS